MRRFFTEMASAAADCSTARKPQKATAKRSRAKRRFGDAIVGAVGVSSQFAARARSRDGGCVCGRDSGLVVRPARPGGEGIRANRRYVLGSFGLAPVKFQAFGYCQRVGDGPSFSKTCRMLVENSLVARYYGIAGRY